MSEAILRSYGTSRKKQNNQLDRVLKIAIVFLVLIILGEVLFYLLIAPNMVLKEVVVKSDLALSDKEILNKAGIEGKEYYFLLDTQLVEKNLESYAPVKEAVVKKSFPDKLHITLYRRKPLGISLVKQNNRTVPFIFDKEGVIFQAGGKETESSLPVLSGIRFENADLGTRLPGPLQPILEDIERIRHNAPELLKQISELRVIRKEENLVEMYLYPMHYRTKVHIGSHLDEELIRYLLMVLHVMDKQNGLEGMKELDFRTGNAVYKVKEG